MLVRIDVGHTAMVALEMQAVRRDHAVQSIDWCTRGAAPRRAGFRLNESACDLALVLDRTPIATHPCPRELHPGRQLRRIGRSGRRPGHGSKPTTSEKRDALP